MGLLLGALYVVGAVVAALSLVYFVKDLAADLLLMGLSALISAAWIVGALILTIHALGESGPDDAITLWGYVATAVALPLGSIYLAFLERTKWGSIAVGAVALTTVFLAYRLPQIWPGAFG